MQELILQFYLMEELEVLVVAHLFLQVVLVASPVVEVEAVVV